MTESQVIPIRCTLKARQLLESFDQNLTRLQTQGLDKDENEVDTLERLSEHLEEAIENDVAPEQLQDRAQALADYALGRGYHAHEVENLLTMRPNPNGKRPT